VRLRSVHKGVSDRLLVLILLNGTLAVLTRYGRLNLDANSFEFRPRCAALGPGDVFRLARFARRRTHQGTGNPCLSQESPLLTLWAHTRGLLGVLKGDPAHCRAMGGRL